MGILYIVPTPIGNLEDISLRAMKVLASVDAIACEDTRKTSQLIGLLRQRYPDLYVQTPEQKENQRYIRYYEQVEDRKIPEIITALKNGLNIALVSDAGTPTISDPGFRLVRECVHEGIRVESIPGPVSPVIALTVSGLPTDKFLFLGYPPHSSGKRLQLYKNLLEAQKHIKSTIIFFEAPHKLIKTLGELKEVFGNIDIVLTRELTKVHEEVLRGSIAALLTGFEKRPPKGEFVVLVNIQIQEQVKDMLESTLRLE